MSNRRRYLLALNVILMITGAYIYFKQTNRTGAITSRYQEGIVRIHQYLFHLNVECRRGQYDIAQNTFLDLQQHWQRQDILYRYLPGSAPLAGDYFPSDSLKTLENHLNQLYDCPGADMQPDRIVREIKRITAKVDRMGIIR